MMEQLTWRKASASGNQNACVELACTREDRLVRDSKNPDGPRLKFPPGAVARMLETLRND
jgi:hypothetical protein